MDTGTDSSIQSPALDRKRAALWYAEEYGFPVLPLHTMRDGRCTCNRTGCKPGKHPRTLAGVKDATTEPETIQKWWRMWPDSNIGLACGADGGFFVLDVDVQNGGDVSLRELEAKHGTLPATWRVQTGGGGRHYYFKDHNAVGNSTGRVAAGIDIKSDGGYVVAPPSDHESGNIYSWVDGFRPDQATMQEAPEWLVRLATRKNQNAPMGPDGNGVIPEGKRNSTLARYAGVMQRRGMPVEGIEAALMAMNSKRCTPPLEPGEVLGIVRSISRYSPAESVEPDPTREKANRFPALTVEELESLPPPEWLLEGYLVGGSLATMYGQWGQGKSFVALDVGLRTAAGLPWCGHATKQGTVLYVCGEGLPGINRRISAWLSQFETFPDVSRFYLCREMPRLLQREDRVAFLDSLARLPEYPSLVILDTLARCLVGGEENSAKDMGVLMDACQAIADRTGGAVLLVHHTGKSGETIRGSSALPGAVDTLLEVSKSGDLVTVKTIKQKDSDAAPPISLKLVVVPLGYDEDFNEVSSCYPDPQKALDLSLWSRPDLGPTLAVLKSHFLDQGASFTDWHEAAGIAKSSFCLYRTFLVDNGYVRLEGNGRGAKYVLTDKGRSKVQLGPT